MLEILDGDMKALKRAVETHQSSAEREGAEEGERYYDYEHDILDNRIFYIDDNDQMQEDELASNIKIPHPFFTELVDQASSTLLSNGVELQTEDESFLKYLEEYWDEDIQLFLQEIIDGAAIKGKEYAYVKQMPGNYDASRITFQVADSLQTFPIINGAGETVGVVRYYDLELMIDDKPEMVEHAEVWTADDVTFYRMNKKREFELNTDRLPNPRKHILAEQLNEDDELELLGKSFGLVPFFKLKNNRKEFSDLKPIKELIDDYDLMNAFMSNNLQDYSGAIYVTKGFPGDDLNKLRTNIRGKGAINVDEDGDFDLKTYNIPVDGRVKKMDLDKQNIYKFGMAFDSTAVSDSQGNVTNVQILAGYSLLMMKLNKKEAYLRTLINWMLELITEDINRRYATNYSHLDITVNIEREVMANRLENADIEKREEETKQLKITTLLDVAMFLPQEKVLREICDVLELDWEEVEVLLEQEAYLPSLAGVGDEEPEEPEETEGEETEVDDNAENEQV